MGITKLENYRLFNAFIYIEQNKLYIENIINIFYVYKMKIEIFIKANIICRHSNY